MCACVCACAYECVLACVCVLALMHMRQCAWAHACVRLHVCARVHVCVCAGMRVRVRVLGQSWKGDLADRASEPCSQTQAVPPL